MKYLTLLTLLISACAADVAVDGDEFVDADDLGVAAEALTYQFINSNGGQALTAGTSSHKRMCMRAFVMAIGSTTNSRWWACPNNQDYCEHITAGQADTWRVGGCMNMAVGSWDRACPVTSNGGPPMGFIAYKQTGNTCGFYANLSGALSGNATLSPARADWPPAMTAPSCKPVGYVPPPGIGCSASGGIDVGGGICAKRVCS